VTIILGGDSLLHKKIKDPEINRGSPRRRAPPRGCDKNDEKDDEKQVKNKMKNELKFGLRVT